MDVITLTGNLLAEWTFEIGLTEQGATHRARSMSFQVGGKGINVARILGRLGVESEALAFASGTIVDYCDSWLTEQNIRHRFFSVTDPIRPGVVIRELDGENLPETTFLGKDAQVAAESWAAACRYIKESKSNWVALCGSIPGWQTGWKAAVEEILRSNTRLSVDTYGPPLKDLVSLPLHLVKINRKELGSLLPLAPGESLEDTLSRARKSFPVRNWIITDGPGTMIAAFQDDSVYRIHPAAVTEVSAMGSGDTFLAAFISQWNPGSDAREAMKFACACATGNAASPGIGDFPLPPPEAFFPEIRMINR